jgi:hypothetical protein
MLKENPPTQHNGIGVQTREASSMAESDARLWAWRITPPWLCTTPLGSPVEPDV